MHPKNPHKTRYDLKALGEKSPELVPYVLINKYGDESIDFADAKAVKALNRAILLDSYGIKHWDIPEDYLCPPIPGRADYIHSVADLFSEKKALRVLDIGTGANCIYPLIGAVEYQWSWVGADIDPRAIENAQTIVSKNGLDSQIELRLQTDKKSIFKNIIQSSERFDLTICNPPFHESYEEAMRGTNRKWKNLGKAPKSKTLNFGGKSNELWCPGGESAFILNMIDESVLFKTNVQWFTTLVSKEANLPVLKKALEKKVIAKEIRVIEMTQGQKKSRLLAWTF